MDNYTQAMLGMLAVINPFVCGAMLLQIQQGQDKKSGLKATIKSMSTVLIILLIAALGGSHLLNIFGISMDAFKIVGGIILGVIGFHMLIGPSSNPDAKKNSLNELVMFAASPGTIAMVITLAAVHNTKGLPITAMIGTLLAVLITVAIMILMLYLTKQNMANSQKGFSKFMGLIIVSMGLQFVLVGIKHFFGV